MASEVELLVNGTVYSGWTDVTVRRSIEAVAGSYRLELTDRWPGQSEPWPLLPSDQCTVRDGDDTLISGYIDTIDGTLAGDDHSLGVSGRDRTADLVDSSADMTPGEWSGLTLLQVAQKIAEPYGITVRAEVDVGQPFSVFKLQPSETGFEAIEQAARQRGLLLVSDSEGNLVITRPGNRRTADALIQGENVLRARASASHQDRYARYVCLGQRPGDDNTFGEQAAGVRAEARDSAIGNRERTLVVIAEKGVSPAAAKNRAEWEAATRAARAATLSVIVQGWRQSDGSLWTPNRLVPVDIPALRAQGDLLISQVTYRYGQQGQLVELALARADAYKPQPVVGDPSIYGATAGGSETNWAEVFNE